MKELLLTDDIALSQSADLSLPDCMHRLVTPDGAPRAFGRSESEACRHPLFDEAVVLRDDVVQVGRCSTTTAPTQFAGLLQFVIALAYAGCPSTLMTRGEGPPPDSARR